ncbi:meiotically up-regulated protein [Plectosphaerella plurivora]|uniref:Meiotically up-regulated protein n=1 Tax=Plectosphaerella plurivora TaxID=936078 RepID=A0A9P8V7E4_9PEZI|nr:meiotically up-regulated protein [Plectosphaerella plurivora]
MGAQQSSGREGEPASTLVKTCYYELLGVERDADEEELKKAYKKKALLLHPDRNYGDVENATKRFAEVRSAYEVLSDPQERAWYDSHRDAILKGAGPDDMDNFSEFNNVKLTSTQDIFDLIRRFNATVPFNDEPNGFFGIAAETFARLADEELGAGEYDDHDRPEYPPFGDSSDSYDPVVKQFYAGWTGFSTRKSFAWKDKYRLGEAPDRRVRRLMEKENKKLRDEAVREFNDAVRFLVTFVRKRDTRYLPNHQTSAERQAALRSAAAAQAARSRAANSEKIRDEPVATWAQPQTHDVGEHFSDVEDDSEVEHIECVVCDKTFKSEKSFEAHEKSKKHIKAVQKLRRQMQKEGTDLDLDQPAEGDQTPVNDPDASSVHAADDRAADEDISAAAAALSMAAGPSPDADELEVDAMSEASFDAMQEISSDSRASAGSPAGVQNDDSAGDESLRGTDGGKDTKDVLRTGEDNDNLRVGSARKVGKAKEKRAKKAARAATASTSETFKAQ